MLTELLITANVIGDCVM